MAIMLTGRPSRVEGACFSTVTISRARALLLANVGLAGWVQSQVRQSTPRPGAATRLLPSEQPSPESADAGMANAEVVSESGLPRPKEPGDGALWRWG